MASQTGLRDVTAAPGSWRKKAVELVGLVVSRTASQRAWARRHAAASSAYARSGGDYVCSSNDFSVPPRALLMEVEDFTPAQEVRFGSRSWPAPRGADSILAALYGPTYLTPPPIEEQKPIHFRNGIRRSELRDR